MKMQCPRCGVKGSLDDAYVGKKIECPRCKNMFLADPKLVRAVDQGRENRGEIVPESEDQGREGEEDTTADALAAAAAEKTSELKEEITGTPDTDITEANIPDESADAVSTGTEAAAPGAEESRAEKTIAEPETVARVDSGPASALAAAPEELATPGPLQDVACPAGEFSLGKALSTAWALTSGVKAPIWVGLLISHGALVALVSGVTALAVLTGQSPEGIVGAVGELVSSALSAIFTAGLMFMGVKRATGRRVVWKDVFSGFEVSGKILVAAILQMLLVTIGFLLLILPGIYLMVGYLLTMPLIIDKKLTPWQAMEASRQAIHTIWWKMLGLYFLVGLICAVSAIPFGIGLIWTIPMSVILCGVVYDNLFPAQKKAD